MAANIDAVFMTDQSNSNTDHVNSEVISTIGNSTLFKWIIIFSFCFLLVNSFRLLVFVEEAHNQDPVPGKQAGRTFRALGIF